MNEILTDEEISAGIEEIMFCKGGCQGACRERKKAILATLDQRTAERDRLVEAVEPIVNSCSVEYLFEGLNTDQVIELVLTLAAALKEVKGED